MLRLYHARSLVPVAAKSKCCRASRAAQSTWETRLAPSDRTRGNRTSTPESPGWEIPEAHRARTGEQHSQLCVLRHESTPVAHATDAIGTGLLEKRFYGCFVRRLYNESRPHRALGEKTPNEFANEIAASRDFLGQQTAENSL